VPRSNPSTSDDGETLSLTEQVRSAVTEKPASRRRLVCLTGRAAITLGVIGAIVYWVRFSPVPVIRHNLGRFVLTTIGLGMLTLADHSPKFRE